MVLIKTLRHALASAFTTNDASCVRPSGAHGNAYSQQSATGEGAGPCGFAKLPVELRSMILGHMRQADLYACSLVGGPFRVVTSSADFKMQLNPQLQQVLHRDAALVTRSAAWTQERPYAIEVHPSKHAALYFLSSYHLGQSVGEQETAVWNLLHPDRGPVVLKTNMPQDDRSDSNTLISQDRYCTRLMHARWRWGISPKRPPHRVWDLFNPTRAKPALVAPLADMRLATAVDTGVLALGFMADSQQPRRVGEVCVQTAANKVIASFVTPHRDPVRQVVLTRNARFVVARTDKQIVVWARHDQARKTWNLEPPKPYCGVRSVHVDPSGQYLLAALQRDPLPATGIDTSVSVDACLAIWRTDSLEKCISFATTFVEGHIGAIQFAQCNTLTALRDEHRVLIAFGQHRANYRHHTTRVWAPGLTSKSFLLSPSLSPMHGFKNMEGDDVGYAHFSDAPGIAHRFITATCHDFAKWAHVWELDAAGIRSHGPPVKLTTLYLHRGPAQDGLGKEALAFDAEGVYFWRLQHARNSSDTANPLYQSMATLCTLDAATNQWRDIAHYKNALLAPDYRLMLQAQQPGTYHLWNVSRPAANATAVARPDALAGSDAMRLDRV